MLLNNFLEALGTHNSSISIHLVSGEYYIGQYELTSDPNIILMKTSSGEVKIQLWTIKRFKLLGN